jgi:hypothetical protein
MELLFHQHIITYKLTENNYEMRFKKNSKFYLVDWDARGRQIKSKAFRGIWRLNVGNY